MQMEIASSVNFDYRSGTITVDKRDVELQKSLIQSNERLTERKRFYEVEIISMPWSDKPLIMIGTNPNRKRSDKLAWNMPRSFRYSSKDGGVFAVDQGLRSDVPFGRIGDRIVVYAEAIFDDASIINIFLNGSLVYRQWVTVPPIDLCPAIGVSTGPVKLEVYWPGWLNEPSVKFSMQKLPTLMTSWVGYQHTEKNNQDQTLCITKHDSTKRPAYSLQAPRPLDKKDSYFEIELLTRQDVNFGPSVGLTPAWTSKFAYPGWKPDTIGYHSDDGNFYNDDGIQSDGGGEGLACHVGDRMGCGIVFLDTKFDHRTPQLIVVYFTKNGQVVGMKPRRLPLGGFYPTVGMYPEGEKVHVINPALPPTIPPEVTSIFMKWTKVYDDFRFNEAIVFKSFDSGTSTLTVNNSNTYAQYIYLLSNSVKEPDVFFHFEIVAIEESSEVHVCAIPKLDARCEHQLPLKGPVLMADQKRSVCISPKTGTVKQGDQVSVVISKKKPNKVSITALVHGEVRASVTSESTEEIVPHLVFQNGPVTLDVMWPGSPNLHSVKEQLNLEAVRVSEEKLYNNTSQPKTDMHEMSSNALETVLDEVNSVPNPAEYNPEEYATNKVVERKRTPEFSGYTYTPRTFKSRKSSTCQIL